MKKKCVHQLRPCLIRDQLLGFLLRKGIINRNQHGFISNHSTCTNLLECTHDWLVALNSSRTTDIINIDFLRAFDSIVCNKLFNKLQSYGITGKLLHWQLSIIVQKCCVLSTVINKRTSHSGSNKYYLNGALLTNNVNVLDLGITISDGLSSNVHINNIVHRALQRSSTLFHGFASRNLELMRKAFVTYIRPILEYNSILWSPNLLDFIDLIESVRRKFTKRNNSLASVPYSNRLNLLNYL